MAVTQTTSIEETISRAREAQRCWAAVPVARRLRLLRRVRHLIAERWSGLAQAAGPRPGCSVADVLACEIVPLADACRFLEREAEALLRRRVLGRAGRPAWLFGCRAEVRREPLGVVLVIGPRNYPLFIPGVQLLQGLAAGNGVVLKPGQGGSASLAALTEIAGECGIDPALMPLIGEDPAAGERAIAAGVDKVFLTGSAETGTRVLATAAPRLTGAVMELSGNDPVFIMEGADLGMAAAAIAYGIRLNGSATCIAPRRVYLPAAMEAELAERLIRNLAEMPKVRLEPEPAQRVSVLLGRAVAAGARLLGGQMPVPTDCPPLILTGVDPQAEILRTSVFAPIISLVPVHSDTEALAQARFSPFALGASVFGPRRAAHAMAAAITAGLVTINDIIVPSADPRLPFGGRGRSGFGTTRGREGLLEMTAIKTVAVRRGCFRPHYRALGDSDAALLGDALQAMHAAGSGTRARASGRLLLGLARWRWRPDRRGLSRSELLGAR